MSRDERPTHRRPGYVRFTPAGSTPIRRYERTWRVPVWVWPLILFVLLYLIV